ncbi:MAG: hemerythrin family protein [Chlorobi bacterium]|nr:hemerythrin family protein [Chlorobiota bacterium]
MEKKALYPKYTWQDKYNVDILSIDLQHQKFLEIFNKLSDIINFKSCKDKVSEIFFSLGHFTENYFTKEEMLFNNYKYPNFTAHKEAHNNFIAQIIHFNKNYINGKEDVCIELYQFLEKWFKNHILEYDKDAVTFLKEKGL